MKKLFTTLCLFSMFALTVGASFASDSECTKCDCAKKCDCECHKVIKKCDCKSDCDCCKNGDCKCKEENCECLNNNDCSNHKCDCKKMKKVKKSK
ncbi:MAG: hypothetical protein BHW64_02885 [Candidatus Melainabacteria bacterium LEY3_CP_29_8]|nr:MAG: hypothetical protein BHW64_02885 [Candidatus Melainabacteria bacterium LEY3_CP_29_8]